DNPHEEKTDRKENACTKDTTHVAKTQTAFAIADCGPLDNNCIVIEQHDINTAVQQEDMSSGPEKTTTERDEININGRGITTPKKLRVDNSMMCCLHNGDENKDMEESIDKENNPPRFDFHSDCVAMAMEESGRCDVDKDCKMDEVDHAALTTASVQSNDSQKSTDNQSLSSLSIVIPHILRSEHSTAFQDDFVIAKVTILLLFFKKKKKKKKYCDIGTISPGVTDDVTKDDTFDSINVTASESVVTHNCGNSEEQTPVAADIIADQLSQSANSFVLILCSKKKKKKEEEQE
ncbi:hypothetical protein RFI_22537, partial [Reticulomyxa filosa]